MRGRTDLSAVALPVVLLAIAAWAALSSREIWPSVLAAGVALVVAGARRWPLIGVAVSFFGLFAASRSVTTDDPFLALVVVACFLGGRYSRPSRQPWAVTGVLLLLSSNVLQSGRGPDATAIFPVLLTGGPWLLGFIVQEAVRREQLAVTRAALLEREQATHIRQATAEERLEIAREFHDIVAHEISALSLQAQLARRVAEGGGIVTADTLLAIERTAQTAMTDVRRLLGVLRSSDPAATEPAHGWGDLDALIGKERALGHAVVVDEFGSRRAMPPALSHAAYRIAQECLTNARRHGCGAARLLIEWLPQALRLTVSNPIHSGGPAVIGHGLAGIAERAALFGGSVDTSASAVEWKVRVVLPTAVLAP